MPADEDGTLLRLAESITDGTPVDWEAEHAAHGKAAPRLQPLRLIEGVASAYRAVHSSAPGAPAGLEETASVILPSPGPADALSAPRAPKDTRTEQSGASETPATWGPLRIVERIGSGAFGEIYRAFDPSLRKEVALKLRGVARSAGGVEERRFLKEARSLARVRHPNVLAVHGADTHDGRIGIWTDLLRGRTLEQMLAAQGPFGGQEAALAGITLSHALAAVHAAGLVHGDVKTSNIMREQGGQIVLMDFGSALDRPGPGAAPAGAVSPSGTPLFMAPEQLLDGRPASPASDIYAAGVVLYRLVTGRFPIEAASWAELLERHRAGARLPLRDLRPDLPAPFVRVVERALSQDPAARHGSAGELERALIDAIGAPAPRTQEGPGGVTRPWWKRPLPWISLAATVAALAFGARILMPGIFPHPFTAEASLYRMGPGSTQEKLLPLAPVHPGDRLFLEIQGRDPMYVYVLNEDEIGNTFVLFPAGLDLQNPLAADVRHRLPGRLAGDQMTWEVTSAGRKENFLVICARAPLPDLERDLAQLPRAEQGRQVAYAQVSSQSMSHLRGVGGLAPATPPADPGPGHRLSGIAHNLAAASAGSNDIWTWEIQLENPGT